MCGGMRLQRDLGGAENEGEEDGRDGDDMGRVQQGQIGEVVVIDDGAREGGLVRGELEAGREVVQGAVRVVHDQLRVQLRDQRKLALAEAGDVSVGHLRPDVARLDHDEADVVRALLHLAGEVEGRGDDEVRVRAPDGHFEVVALEIDLGGGESLLPDGETLAEFDDF